MVQKVSSVDRVRNALASRGIPTTEIKELPDSTRTAPEAAVAVGCDVGQIVKSLVFYGRESKRPILILTSGANQVNQDLVSGVIGERIDFASVDFVREETGFSIGGVAPFGLKKEISTYIDEDLLGHTLLWAAAGSHHAVFSIHPDDLVEGTGARVIPVH
jgi:prolyl-tRNA editing enzyme YbaK/EbsC (Cys-tRNA(Pro) deacylase)